MPLGSGSTHVRSTTDIDNDSVETADIKDAQVTLAKLASGTRGDILYAGASGLWAKLAASTSGYFLKTFGAGADPAWAAVPALPTVLTMIPRPAGYYDEFATAQVLYNDNTLGRVCMIYVPFNITINKFSVRTGATVPATAGTVKFGIYSDDGQTQVAAITTTSMSAANTMYSTAVSAVALAPGYYWLLGLANGTFSGRLNCYETSTENTLLTGPTVEFNLISSEPSLNGTYTCAASTLPATITVASITDTQTTNQCPKFRLDN